MQRYTEKLPKFFQQTAMAAAAEQSLTKAEKREGGGERGCAATYGGHLPFSGEKRGQRVGE